ncbi:MAG: hypothetical protein WDA17_00625 [Sphaerochaetaceae bacterium]|jgi:flagellar biosynthesis protein FlhF
MHYITITGKDFDEALKKGQTQFGGDLRIHSRRDVISKGGFFGLKKKNFVELTCYLAPTGETEELETEIDDEITAEVSEKTHRQKLLDHASVILKQNGFSAKFSDATLNLLEPLVDYDESQLPKINEFELMLVDKIVALVNIDYESQLNPPSVFVLIGPSSMGKSSIASKIGALYTVQEDPNFFRKVEFIELDTAFKESSTSLKETADKFDLPYSRATSKTDLSILLSQMPTEGALTIVDVAGFSAKDEKKFEQVREILRITDLEKTKFVLVLSATTKSEDLKAMVKKYSAFPLSLVVITNVDETESIGSILSACYENNLSLLFFSDGKRIPEDMHKASAAGMLGLLKSLNLDFNSLWANQFGSYTPNSEQ